MFFLKPLFDKRSRFRQLGQIGQGQFGRVYFAVNRQTGEFVALKDLSPTTFPTNKFLRELTYLVTLRHPNIVAFIALEHHRHGRYLITDYCEAGTLRDLMETEGTLNPVQSLKLVGDILLGLDHAHKRHIIHCDIKPENILLNLTARGWNARISDFGIAQLGKETGMPNLGKGYTGSPAYMAPERLYGNFSPLSDLYSVGVLLYELVVGDRPFGGLPKEVMAAHLNTTPKIPDTIAPILRSLLERALQKLPQHRFSSAQEMLKSVRLAGQLLSTDLGLKMWLSAPAPLPITASIHILWTAEFPREIDQFAIAAPEGEDINHRKFYWRSGHHLGWLTFKSNIFDHQSFWEITLPDLIEAIQIRPTGCFITTQSQHQWHLYRWRISAPFPSQPLFMGKGQHHRLTINATGEWGVIVSQQTHEIAYQRLNMITQQSLPIASNLPFPSHLIALDSRHVLALLDQSPYPNSRTYFALLNRRGSVMRGFTLPIHLRSLIQGESTSLSLLGIEESKTALGAIIGLIPLKINRFPLNLDPAFMAAYGWGFCLMDRQGLGVLLDHYGTQIARFEVKGEITAIAAVGESQLLVANRVQDKYFISLVDFCELSLLGND